MNETLFRSRCIVAAALLSIFAPFAHAGPGLQHWTTLRQEAQFKKLKVEDKLAFVCDGCKTVSEITIKSPEHASTLIQEGGTVGCPSCKAEFKVTMKGPSRNPTIQREVIYVDEKGKERAFVATAIDSQ
jgi:phage FluMu protein Com